MDETMLKLEAAEDKIQGLETAKEEMRNEVC